MTAIRAYDLFCGAGGWTTGAYQACEALGLELDMKCLNHWGPACNTIQSNHPVIPVKDKFNKVDPRKVGQLFGLIASPECTYFSVALGGKPRKDQKRSPAQNLPKWIAATRPAFFAIENVKEFQKWGELDENDQLIPGTEGTLFQEKLVKPIRKLGYSVEWRVLCCADYGDPTTRRRMFILGRRDGKPVQWPEPTHADAPTPGQKPWVPARDAIDWSLPSKSIFSRKKPLCKKTLARIEAGIRKFWGPWAEPFLVILKGRSTARSVNDPMPTLTTGQNMALSQPFLVNQKGGTPAHLQASSQSLDQPAPAICAGGTHLGVCQPFITQNEHGGRVHDPQRPMPTITGSGRGFDLVQPFLIGQHSGSAPRPVEKPVMTICTESRGMGLCEPFIIEYYGRGSGDQPQPITRPLPTVTCKDRFGVVQQYGLDILYRMLQPHELAAAMGFPKDYLFYGNKTQVVRQIGNAVPVNTARALLECLIAQTLHLLEEAA